MTANELISAIIGMIVGAGISIPITIRFTKSKSNNNIVNQNNIRTKGGDVTGRDKK